MRSMATNMTAVHQSAYGLDAIGIREKPAPSAGPEQVRIKVTASTVNPMGLAPCHGRGSRRVGMRGCEATGSAPHK